MFVEHAQVELHQVPADDCIGVVGSQPLVEALEQLGAGIAVVEFEVHRIGFVWRAEHVHLALAAAFQGNGIQIALGGGLDVQGHQFERRAVVRRGFHLRLKQGAAGIRCAAKPHGRGDEAFHHVTLGRAHVGFVDVDTGGAQALFQVHQLAVLAGVETKDRAMMEVAQLQRAQFNLALALEQPVERLAMGLRNKHHRGLHG